MNKLEECQLMISQLLSSSRKSVQAIAQSVQEEPDRAARKLSWEAEDLIKDAQIVSVINQYDAVENPERALSIITDEILTGDSGSGNSSLSHRLGAAKRIEAMQEVHKILTQHLVER
jgi:hypothetical protein